MRCALNDRGVMEVRGSFGGNDREWQTPALDAGGVARVRGSAARWGAILFWVMVAVLALQLFNWLH